MILQNSPDIVAVVGGEGSIASRFTYFIPERYPGKPHSPMERRRLLPMGATSNRRRSEI